jgi:putative sterol carrier protein
MITSASSTHRTRSGSQRQVAASSRDRRPSSSNPTVARRVATAFAAPRRAGVDDTIAEGFATMEARFKRDAAKGISTRMQFVLTGPGGGTWFVVIKDQKCTVTTGEGSDPDATLMATASDYRKIFDGEMNKIVALLRGKLRVKGDMGAVRPFFACFKKR